MDKYSDYYFFTDCRITSKTSITLFALIASAPAKYINQIGNEKSVSNAFAESAANVISEKLKVLQQKPA